MQGSNVLTFEVTGKTYRELMAKAGGFIDQFFSNDDRPTTVTRVLVAKPGLRTVNGSGETLFVDWEADVTLTWDNPT